MAKIYYGNQRIDGNEINTENIVDEAITNEKLANDSVSTSKVENGSITENKLSAAVQEKLNREVGITDYDDLDNKPVINVKIESEMDLYTGLKDAENGMMIRATTVPAEYITDNTLYEADSHWYLRLIPFYATYDEAEHRFTLIDQCVETYTVPGHDFDTVVGKLASGTIVVNGQTESVALSLSQATDHDTGEILVDGLILTGDYQDHPEDAPEYQILFNSHTGIRTAELTLNYDVEFDTIIDQNVLDQIVSVTLEQNGYYTIDALNIRDGLSFNEVLDKTKLKTINGTSVVGSGDIKVTTFQPFNSSWPTSSSYTTSQFCQAVNDDTNAIVGMAYLGGAKWSDMPSGLSNCDVVVEVLQGPNANTKSIHLIITSGSVAPYTWEYTWWSGSSPQGWVSFKSSIVAGNNVQLSDDSSHRLVISATDTTYTNGNGLNLSGTEFSVDTSVIATQSDLQGKQDVLTPGANINIDANNEISATDTTYSAGNNISIDSNHNNAISVDSTGATSGYVLTADGSGSASWQAPAGGAVDYNNVSNKPIVNQDLEAENFVPVANTYYRHTGQGGGGPIFRGFEQGDILSGGDKIHFDRTADMDTFLAGLTYDPNTGECVLLQGTYNGQTQNILKVFGYTGYFYFLVTDKFNMMSGSLDGLLYVYDPSGSVSIDPGWQTCVDANGDLELDSTVLDTPTEVTTINDYDNWNGSIAGIMSAGSPFETGVIYFYDGTNYNRVIDMSKVDTVPTQGSTNLITSGAVYAALGDLEYRLSQI